MRQDTKHPKAVARWLRSLMIEPLYYHERFSNVVTRTVTELSENELDDRGIEVCEAAGIAIAGMPLDLSARRFLSLNTMIASGRHGDAREFHHETKVFLHRLGNFQANLESEGLRWRLAGAPPSGAMRKADHVIDIPGVELLHSDVGIRRPATTGDRKELVEIVLEQVDRHWGLDLLRQKYEEARAANRPGV